MEWKGGGKTKPVFEVDVCMLSGTKGLGWGI